MITINDIIKDFHHMEAVKSYQEKYCPEIEYPKSISTTPDSITSLNNWYRDIESKMLLAGQLKL